MSSQLEKTIAELSKNPAEADTVTALKRQLEDKQKNQCIYMIDTGKSKLDNLPCKGNAIICKHKEIGEEASKVMTTRKCNSKYCKYFQPLILKIN